MTAKHRILIVDDSPTNRLILMKSLPKDDYEPIEAATGEDALRIAREARPEAVLLDVSMPGMDGFEVCRALKSSKDTSETPVIFLTAHSAPEDIEQAFAVGGCDYVRKPFHLGEVKARLSVHLKLRQAMQTIAQTHTQLLHAQKMESIGRLAAGIAHEINTPTQFVGDNARFLQECISELLPIFGEASRLADAVCDGHVAVDLAHSLRRRLDQSDLEYLSREIPRALEQSLDGIQRVSRIVRAMKEFSHPGVEAMTRIDLNRAIENTVTVASNEWKYVASVVLHLDPDLPHVLCYPGEFNQVVLNMVVNAAHAIGDVVGDGSSGKGEIAIRTRAFGDSVEVSISDTGTGIAPEARDRVFDPFFTTKEVGKGTGQGLAIAHNVIVQKHGGKIALESEVGRGTTFFIRLPVSRNVEEAA